MPVGDEFTVSGGYVCQKAVRHLQSARRNNHGNRDNATKQTAEINESRRGQSQAAWTRWQNCANTPPSRQRYSILAQRTRTLRSIPPPVTTSTGNSSCKVARANAL